MDHPIQTSTVLKDVRYEIRGQLANRAFEGVLDDQAFALELLEKHHILVAPGSSFNTPYSDHFRVTTLPDIETLDVVFDRIDACLAQHA